MNSEIKKESYNLSEEDKNNMRKLNNNIEVLWGQQEEIVKQQKEWINNTSIALNHKITLEDKALSNRIADKIVQEVTPNVANTFNRETELIKSKSKDMEQSINNIEKQMTRYKSIAVTGIVAFFVIAIIVLLFTAMSNGLFNFLGIEMWYNIIGTHMEKSKGFMIILWGVAYVLPYFIFAGIVLLLGWATKKFLL
ncbi:DUF334 domain-containing protein [Staphylococcus hominis]|uniref:DUF334 domain-containing protein n=2 Tax=Staphylococcus hominis TaxID=1290 RepID=UPI0034D5A46D